MPFLRLFLALMLAATAFAQKKEHTEFRWLIPDKIERETKADDTGMLQWVEYKPVQCPTCKGKGKVTCPTCERFLDDATTCPECKRNKEREAVCRVCAGKGELPDPLDKVICPECMGATFMICPLCAGSGRIKTEGGGDRFGACPVCRGDGGFKCAVCEGSRYVDTAALKPSLREANAATLTKALAVVDQMIPAIDAFTPTGKNTRKEAKELIKIFEKGQAVFLPLKKSPKALEGYLGKIYAGRQFVGAEQNEANALNLFKSNTEYYLKHQKRMMELALKRAEANEKLAAEKK